MEITAEMIFGDSTIMSDHKGQGLIELMVAIAVIVAGLVGVLSLFQIVIRARSTSTEEIQAAFLGAEGIELIRNKKESNEMANLPWWQDLRDDGTLIIDINNMDFVPDDLDDCAGVECGLTRGADGFLTHGAGGKTIFSRIIELREICEGDDVLDVGARCEAGEMIGMDVHSIVRFQGKNDASEIGLYERLYHWRII